MSIENLLYSNTHKMPYEQPNLSMVLPSPSSSKYSPPALPSTGSSQSYFTQQEQQQQLLSQPQPQQLQQQASQLKFSLPPIRELLKEQNGTTAPSSTSTGSTTANSSSPSTPASITTQHNQQQSQQQQQQQQQHQHQIQLQQQLQLQQQHQQQQHQQHQPQQQQQHQLQQHQPLPLQHPQQQSLEPLITQQFLQQQFGHQDGYQPVYSHQPLQYQQPGRISPSVLPNGTVSLLQQLPQPAPVPYYNPATGRLEHQLLPQNSSPVLLDEKVANQQMRKKRQNLPRQTTLILLNWLSDHLDRPYPNSREKYELLLKTRLTIQQLDNWFINARRRKINILRKLKENDQSISLTF